MPKHGKRGSKSGGTLKRSTGRMKIRHMNMVLDFKHRLKTPSDRDSALIEIKDLMDERGAYWKHEKWFQYIYKAYRTKNIPTYEKKIFNKLKYERALARRLARAKTGENIL